MLEDERVQGDELRIREFGQVGTVVERGKVERNAEEMGRGGRRGLRVKRDGRAQAR